MPARRAQLHGAHSLVVRRYAVNDGLDYYMAPFAGVVAALPARDLRCEFCQMHAGRLYPEGNFS